MVGTNQTQNIPNFMNLLNDQFRKLTDTFFSISETFWFCIAIYQVYFLIIKMPLIGEQTYHHLYNCLLPDVDKNGVPIGLIPQIYDPDDAPYLKEKYGIDSEACFLMPKSGFRFTMT